MKAKHTPGPWALLVRPYEGHKPASNDYVGEICASGGTKIYAGPFSFHAMRGRTPAEANANAHLIAAAPDLLGVLERIVDAYPTLPEGDDARAAIAKARGV